MMAPNQIFECGNVFFILAMIVQSTARHVSMYISRVLTPQLDDVMMQFLMQCNYTKLDFQEIPCPDLILWNMIIIKNVSGKK